MVHLLVILPQSNLDDFAISHTMRTLTARFVLT